MDFDWDMMRNVFSYILLFLLIFGMTATVSVQNLKMQLKNRVALATGVFLQFIVMPFLGFLIVKILELDFPEGVTLLVLTSSPGGSYSNWCCSLFNADLGLSVAMTTVSTLTSLIALPINLTIYATNAYSSDIIKSLDWASLYISLFVVIGAVLSGLILSARMQSIAFQKIGNLIGNLAGTGLVILSLWGLYSSQDELGGDIWARDWKFYVGVASPFVLGLLLATSMACYLQFKKPERISFSVECCYQNVGIATFLAMTMFQGAPLKGAIGVPLFYGVLQAALMGIYCIMMWKIGWSKAPRDTSIFRILSSSYEIGEEHEIVPEKRDQETKRNMEVDMSGKSAIDPDIMIDTTMDLGDDECWSDDDMRQSKLNIFAAPIREAPNLARTLRGYLTAYNDEDLAADGLSIAESDLESGMSMAPEDTTVV